MIATMEDYAAVRELVVDLISDGIGATVSEATRQTVNAVAEVVASGEEYASNAQLAALLELDKAAVSRRVRVAINQGYLRMTRTVGGSRRSWRSPIRCPRTSRSYRPLTC